MTIQIITTEEAMQDVFNTAFAKALENYEPKDSKPQPFIVTGEVLCQRFNITIPTLIRWRKKGKIPFMQIGSAIRYDINKVIEALEVGKKKGAIKI